MTRKYIPIHVLVLFWSLSSIVRATHWNFGVTSFSLSIPTEHLTDLKIPYGRVFIETVTHFLYVRFVKYFFEKPR